MFTSCPKCGHKPLPEDQRLPASCPACGVILAKLFAPPQDVPGNNLPLPAVAADSALTTPEVVDPVDFGARLLAWIAFALWGFNLIAQDFRTGELGMSFLHRPLLVFHEAGHVVFRLFGEWVMVLGGTLGQLIMPAVLGIALLIKNRDRFGASIALWFFGVSLLDIAPYMYDALHPQLMLLSGTTGEEGGHDWIYLFSSMGLLGKAQVMGNVCHKLGALTILSAIVWGAAVLRTQFAGMRQSR